MVPRELYVRIRCFHGSYGTLCTVSSVYFMYELFMVPSLYFMYEVFMVPSVYFMYKVFMVPSVLYAQEFHGS